MGTRNLTCVYMDQEYKVAQYCQWDGYPSGQGITVLNFLKNEMNESAFRSALRNVQVIDHAAVGKIQQGYATSDPVFPNSMSMSDYENFCNDHPELGRSMGAKILQKIQDCNGRIALMHDLEFAADSLMCEWAYVLDMDRRVLEIYAGWNKKPLKKSERFANLPPCKNFDGTIFYPIPLLKEYRFDDLPEEDDFISELNDMADKRNGAA